MTSHRRRPRLKTIAFEHELFILWLLAVEQEIGRYRLSKMLGISEGVARGILARMRKKGLIVVRRRAGTRASREGARELLTLMKRSRLRLVEKLDEKVLALGQEEVIFQIAGRSNRLGQGIEQRDAAIKAGATGAVTFFFDGKTLRFPGVEEPVSKRSPATFEMLKKRLKMRRRDIVLLAFADTWWDAARGGFAAVKTLT